MCRTLCAPYVITIQRGDRVVKGRKREGREGEWSGGKGNNKKKIKSKKKRRGSRAMDLRKMFVTYYAYVNLKNLSSCKMAFIQKTRQLIFTII